MPILIAEETVFPLSEVPNHVPPRRGKKLHVATVFRWKGGLRGVKLETIRIGGTLHTSAEALQRFFDRLSATDHGPDPAPPADPSKARQRAAERAGRELDSLGF
ncbi:MAG: DUF1580 domain-containing protein [Isosphaeraceae bacterium]